MCTTKRSTEIVEVANNSAKRVDTILKMGRSSKSQMSRWNILRILCFVLFVVSISIILPSCSSPESDGIKVAKLYCEYNKSHDVRKENECYDMLEKYEKKYETDMEKMAQFKYALDHYKCQH